MKQATISIAVVACLAAVSFGQSTRRATSKLKLAARPDFRAVVKRAKGKVFPAVVFIRCLRESHESGKKITRQIAGSGVLISPKGEMVTNWHVVDKTVSIRCLLYDGTTATASVIGKDKDADIALLQLDLPKDSKALPYAKFGDSSKLREGDFVMAMGAPWGLNRSVSIGIISCTRRYLPECSEYSLWFQTDASINPGNSGGPLVNTYGKIIGINTRGGGGMGFAVPSSTVQFIITQFRKHGKVDWSWTGLQLQPLKDFNRDIYFEGTEGVIVANTDPESPARRAGIKLKDRILRVNGERVGAQWVEDLPAVRKFLGLLEKNKPAKFEIQRGDKTVTITLTPRDKGKVEGDELDCPRWDMTVKTVNQFDNPDLYFHRKKGAYVFGIKYPGNAQNAGLRDKDIILKIDGKKILTLDDLKKVHKALLDNIKNKHKVLFVVLRGGLMRQVLMDFSRDYERE